MRTTVDLFLSAALAILIASVPLLAHHGTGVSYNMEKVTVVNGVITKFVFANPHSQLYFDVTDDKGNLTHWAAEMRAPGNLIAQGFSRRELLDKLAPGAQITVTGNPAKSGAPVLVFGKGVLADGWCLCHNGGGIGSTDTQ